MKNEHAKMLRYGVRRWNDWRKGHLWIAEIDLSDAGLSGLSGDLSGIDFRDANLSRAHFSDVCLNGADLRDAKLIGTDLEGAQLVGCDLRGACLDGANLKMANLTGANLGLPDLSDDTLKRRESINKPWVSKATSLKKASLLGATLEGVSAAGAQAEQATFAGADLRRANLGGAYLRGVNLNGATCVAANFQNAILDHSTLVGADLTGADVSGCSVYGISAWDIVLEDANQNNLVITPANFVPVVTDNIELAQFMYLLLNNKKVRGVIDTISTRMVLILGRFTPERKRVLDLIRDNIRRCGGVPILFDFEKPQNRDITETVSTLAHLSRMVIIDLTDAKSVPQELQATIPNLPSVRFHPICAEADREYSMFEHFRRYPWVSQTLFYASDRDLIAKLGVLLEGSTDTSLRKAFPSI